MINCICGGEEDICFLISHLTRVHYVRLDKPKVEYKKKNENINKKKERNNNNNND